MSIFKRKGSLSVGERGEKAAAEYLKGAGYSILETNFCNKTGHRIGEIDILAKHGEEIVFVEVKTRIITQNQILPEENITNSKLYKLSKIAAFYINKNNLQNVAYRFDAITLIADSNENKAKLKHIRNIFI
ncbi:MAG: hypothetical protein US63_C0024G0005 [Candidatus Moranbacteria bacterium GW2011_GWC2_37_8]|nr:MAG: hypothetical protein US63_C0024G0005 [Candidatus Moranbacteria bacterium GW2011_GWC2_37_8]KKQ61483.1 MAG: hypothetical protein US82_C0021G0005 [Parcubacteria group bacterium GW2011_GWC1_38_22]